MKQTKPHRFGKANGLALLARRSLPGLCAAAGIVLVLAASDARAQGIPVFDSTNYIQALATVTNTAQQVQQAVMAVQTAQQQLASLQQLTNVNSIGTILSAAQNRDIMNGVTDLTSLASGNTTQLGAIGQQAKQLQSGYQITSSGNSTVDQQYNQLVQQTTGQVATQAAYAQNLQQVAANRTTGLEQLRSALDTASDPKQVMDLQARIAVEQAHLQNDMLKLQAYKMHNRHPRHPHLAVSSRWRSRTNLPPRSLTMPSLIEIGLPVRCGRHAASGSRCAICFAPNDAGTARGNPA